MNSLKIGTQSVLRAARWGAAILAVTTLACAGWFLNGAMERVSGVSGTGRSPVHVENIDRKLLNELLAAEAARVSEAARLPDKITDPFAPPPSPPTRPEPTPASGPEKTPAQSRTPKG